jgi:hypothetical protein
MFAVNGRNIIFLYTFFHVLRLLFPKYLLVPGDLVAIVPLVLGLLR